AVGRRRSPGAQRLWEEEEKEAGSVRASLVLKWSCEEGAVLCLLVLKAQRLLDQRCPNSPAMAFMVKSMVGGQLKNLTGGLGGEEKGGEEKSPAEAQGMTREEYEEYQKQLVEEKMERDAQFAQRKAERATLRTHFRDKYRLPKNETDDNQIQVVGGEVELPKELAKMIEQDNEEEEEKDSVIGQLTNIQNLDIDSLKGKAQATLDDLKQSAEKCTVM
ncbi:hypothetical protein JD844_014267, partial [Phrynosoma platyrhinos]